MKGMSEICCHTADTGAVALMANQPKTDQQLAECVIAAAIAVGVVTFVVCPGSRNAALVIALTKRNILDFKTYFWPEERSAAFFALGLCRSSAAPVAVVTTSGTAVAELLAATMEAYYSGIPLLLITADRPRCYRHTGAPQCAEQESIFGGYAPFFCDIAEGESCDLSGWQKSYPAHINLCLKDPQRDDTFFRSDIPVKLSGIVEKKVFLERYLLRSNALLIIVGTLSEEESTALLPWLHKIEAPVLCEGPSRLRADKSLKPWALARSDGLLQTAASYGYCVDAILRIGGVPTTGLWRDIEYIESIEVTSIASTPFSGSPISHLLYGDIAELLALSAPPKSFCCAASSRWIGAEQERLTRLVKLFTTFSQAEPSLIYALSRYIPEDSRIFLGNSSPIREWDLAACWGRPQRDIWACRGVNGIDGQLSAFLGLCSEKKSNWAIVGDLTALYDLVAPWILRQLVAIDIQILVINNGGGQIFSKMFSLPEFLNAHILSFQALADLWGMEYERWENIPSGCHRSPGRRLIELCPHADATKLFWNEYSNLG